jgi:hypothetical protein
VRVAPSGRSSPSLTARGWRQAAQSNPADGAGPARTSPHLPASRATTGANASMERCATLM